MLGLFFQTLRLAVTRRASFGAKRDLISCRVERDLLVSKERILLLRSEVTKRASFACKVFFDTSRSLSTRCLVSFCKDCVRHCVNHPSFRSLSLSLSCARSISCARSLSSRASTSFTALALLTLPPPLPSSFLLLLLLLLLNPQPNIGGAETNS